MYKVKLKEFEGPMDLLVYLVENAKMSIYDIRISEITSQYLEYIKGAEEAHMALSEEFTVLAAELIEIKSRMLLPKSSDPEKANEEDPRENLVRRILEYKRFKAAADFLKEQEEAESHSHTKPREDISIYLENPFEILKADNKKLSAAFRAFLLRKQKSEELRRSYEEPRARRVSIEAVTEGIIRFFKEKKKKRVMFSELIQGREKKSETAAIFVSLLDMIKARRASAEQEKLFGDIEINLTEEAK